MTDSNIPNQGSSKRPPPKKLLMVFAPLVFLVLAYVALFTRHGLFGFGRGEVKPVLSQQESQRLTNESKSLIGQGKYQDALAPTLTLYKAYPENHIYIGHLAEIYDHLGRFDEEAKYWEKYLDHAPTPVEACPQVGQAYWKQGDKFEKQAIAAFERCLALDPQNTDSIFYLAHAFEMTGEWARSAELYQKGLAISPEYTDLKLGLARCWVRLDKYSEALQLVEKILAKKPDKADALLILGMIYLHQDNYVEAKKVLMRGIQLSDTDPDFHVLLARVAENMNDNAEALRQYTRLAELRPGDERARSKRDALLAAQKKSK